MADGYLDDGDGPGPNRRELIRRGAVVLGLTAWAAPLVQVVRQGHGRSRQVGTGPEEITVQQVATACTTCPDICPPAICGESGALVCLCAPPADPYPIGDCICGEEVFCEEAILCSAGCPDGWGCAQGCCPEPVCLPPCPAPIAPIAPFADAGVQAQAADDTAALEALRGRGLTAAGRTF